MGAPGRGPAPDRADTLEALGRELDLLRCRAAKGSRKPRVSLTELARRIAVPRSTVHTYVSGRALAPADVLDRIVIALGASPAEQAKWAEAWFRVAAGQRDRTGQAQSIGPLPQGDELVRPPVPKPVFVPREVPPASAILTGREKLIGSVTDSVRRGDGAAPSMAVLVGPAGVGKTALAVACAHRLAQAYPDGQLFATLRGTRARPVDPHSVIGRFLRALGVEGERVPDDPDQRLSMYRSVLAETRTLVVLDDVAKADQVRSLLPPTGGCAVLVTSRSRLAALVGAERWTVPALTGEDALALFGRIVGLERVESEPEASTAIVDACGRLPLATCIAAARLAARPDWTLHEFHARLADERGRLNELAVGDLDVRASIGLSYRALPPRTRALFRRLHLNTADWAAWTADTLLGEPANQALDDLVDAHLVEPAGRDRVGQNRFRMHDLVADYARERALAEETPEQLHQAQARLVADWLALADVAHARIPHDLAPADDGPARDAPPEPVRLAAESPGEWFEAERRSLLTVLEHAVGSGASRVIGALAHRVAGFLHWRSYYDEEAAVLHQAISAVRGRVPEDMLVRLLSMLFAACFRAGRIAVLPDITAEALDRAHALGTVELEIRALIDAGKVAGHLCRTEESLDHHRHAVRLARQAGVEETLLLAGLHALACRLWTFGYADQALPLLEEVLAHDRAHPPTMHTSVRLYHHGLALTATRRWDEAHRALCEAYRVHHELDHGHGAAYVEQALADVEIRQGDWASAAIRLDRARRGQQQDGDSDGLAEVLRSTGDLAAAEGRWSDALARTREALAIWRLLPSPIETVRTLARLERLHNRVADHDAAAECRQEYRSMLADLQLGDSCLYLPPLRPADQASSPLL